MIYCLIFANCVFVDDPLWLEKNLQGELAFDKTALEKCNRSPQLTQSVGCEINQITLNSNTFKN